jgi:hypothetical protein
MRIIFIQLLLAAANQALGTGYSIAPALRHNLQHVSLVELSATLATEYLTFPYLDTTR